MEKFSVQDLGLHVRLNVLTKIDLELNVYFPFIQTHLNALFYNPLSQNFILGLFICTAWPLGGSIVTVFVPAALQLC